MTFGTPSTATILETGAHALFQDDMEYLLDDLKAVLVTSGGCFTERHAKALMGVCTDILTAITSRPNLISVFASSDYMTRIISILAATDPPRHPAILISFSIFVHASSQFSIKLGHICSTSHFHVLFLDTLNCLPQIASTYQRPLSTKSNPMLRSILDTFSPIVASHECLYEMTRSLHQSHPNLALPHSPFLFDSMLQLISAPTAPIPSNFTERNIALLSFFYHSKVSEHRLISSNALIYLYKQPQLSSSLLTLLVNMSNDPILGPWISHSEMFDLVWKDLVCSLNKSLEDKALDHYILLMALLCNIYEQYTHSTPCGVDKREWSDFYHHEHVASLMNLFLSWVQQPLDIKKHILSCYISLLLARILIAWNSTIRDKGLLACDNDYQALVGAKDSIRDYVSLLFSMHEEGSNGAMPQTPGSINCQLSDILSALDSSVF